MSESLINAAHLGGVELTNETLRRIPHQRLLHAAQVGDLHHFYELLRQDSFILEVFDRNPFADTPLHLAVSSGQTHFVVEMANLKPSFTKKLNPDGFTPLHLAAANGHLGIVRKLLRVDKNLCFQRGRDDRIPLHCAVENERVDVLELLISTCPTSITELTGREETVLHLAVKNQKILAFNALVKLLPSLKVVELVSWKDDEGNTVLHLATSSTQLQMMENLLLGDCCKSVRKELMNTTDASGFRALEIFRQLPPTLVDNNDGRLLQKIQHILEDNGDEPKRCSSCSPICLCCCHLMRRLLKPLKVKKETPNSMKNALLVVLVLIATATYQSRVTPTFEQYDNLFPDTKSNSTNTDFNYNPIGEPSLPAWQVPVTAIALFVAETANYAGFILSFALIYNLTDGFPLRRPLRCALIFMLINYVFVAWVTGSGVLQLILTVIILFVIARVNNGRE